VSKGEFPTLPGGFGEKAQPPMSLAVVVAAAVFLRNLVLSLEKKSI
jgi:hypothetical protein